MNHADLEAYAKLLRRNMPHVIRARRDYDARLAEVRELMVAERTGAESEYLNLLVTLIEAYERENVKVPAASPIQILRELMAGRDMTQADLATIVGSSGTASEIYNGKRGTSVGLAKKLADHFSASFALFL